MSDPVIKGVKRPSSRPATHSSSSTSSAKSRRLDAKSARPKAIIKRSGAEKAPVRKATNSKTATAGHGNKAEQTTKTSKRSSQSKPKTASAPSRTAGKSKTADQRAVKKLQKAPRATQSKNKPAKSSTVVKHPTASPAPRPQPTRDQAAALRAFEHAHKEFVAGRFAEARNLFRDLIEQHTGFAEVTARARTYLAIAEARLRSESTLPRDAEALYDRGVIELNRGEYVAAQEMFERAAKSDPEGAHIHYGLAVTRARLGALALALESLERALALEPKLRVRAQHDPDLTALRSEPDFERLIFASRS